MGLDVVQKGDPQASAERVTLKSRQKKERQPRQERNNGDTAAK